jgi:hypothetical protein
LTSTPGWRICFPIAALTPSEATSSKGFLATWNRSGSLGNRFSSMP